MVLLHCFSEKIITQHVNIVKDTLFCWYGLKKHVTLFTELFFYNVIFFPLSAAKLKASYK